MDPLLIECLSDSNCDDNPQNTQIPIIFKLMIITLRLLIIPPYHSQAHIISCNSSKVGCLFLGLVFVFHLITTLLPSITHSLISNKFWFWVWVFLFVGYFFSVWFCLSITATSKQGSKTNKQPTKQTSKQASKQTNKQTSNQAQQFSCCK
jgi:phosphotransferase system  glucose/maltose/N-acetylglucosamine-specific IIC component